jgi:hypothetical protein
MPRRVELRRRHHPAHLTARWVAGVFAGLLVLVGVLGFVAPGRGSTSTAPAYNLFHVAFGVLGLVLAVWGDGTAVRAFLLGFGAIDLYQALASSQGWFPASLFRWTPTDDLLHVVIGAGLVVAGVFL